MGEPRMHNCEAITSEVITAPRTTRVGALCAQAIEEAERGNMHAATECVTAAVRIDCGGLASDGEAIDRALRLVELWSRVWRRS